MRNKKVSLQSLKLLVYGISIVNIMCVNDKIISKAISKINDKIISKAISKIKIKDFKKSFYKL